VAIVTEYYWPAVPGLSIPGRPDSTIVAVALKGDWRDRLPVTSRGPIWEAACGVTCCRAEDTAHQEAQQQDGTGVVRPAELAGLDKSQASRAPKGRETVGAVRHDRQTHEYRPGSRLPSRMLATKRRAFSSPRRIRCGRFDPGITEWDRTRTSAEMTGFIHRTVR
jgi:hypothetical protein